MTAKETAFEAARTAGQILKERVGHVSNIDYKSAFNLVTDVDKKSEATILEILRRDFPNDGILAEEGGGGEGSSKRRWLIDPLDGTTNFAHAYPYFSVSIGLEDDGEVILGVVFNPISNELFWAEKGKGAWLNDKQIHVSPISSIEKSLMATGFPSDTATAAHSNFEEFKTLTNMCHGVRRDGSAALDLCFVACGRFEAYWEWKLAPWDIGGGSVIVTEAGGKVTNLENKKMDISKGHILASNGLIHDQVVEVIQSLSKSAV